MFVRGILLFLAAAMPLALQAQTQSKQDECLLTQPGVCARHVLGDEIGILTSPLHVRTKDLLWIVPFGVATGVSLHYDAEAMSELGYDPSRQNTFDTISNVGAVYVPIAAIVGGYAAGAWRKDDYLQQTAVLSAEAILDAQIINLPLKYAINRQTPDQGDGTGRFWPHGPSTWPDGQSMPSGHSLTAWSMAHVVAARYPSWRVRLVGVRTGDNCERIAGDGAAAFSVRRGGRQHAWLPDRRLCGQKARRAEQELYLLHGGYAEWAGHAVVL